MVFSAMLCNLFFLQSKICFICDSCSYKLCYVLLAIMLHSDGGYTAMLIAVRGMQYALWVYWDWECA